MTKLPAHNGTYIPKTWQKRIRTLPSLIVRARLAVYLITAYKRRRERNPTLSEWKQDAHLGTLAFWPPHTKYTLTKLHMHFMRTDPRYCVLTGLNIKQHSSNTIGAAPISNPNPCSVGARHD